jgi:hypothetical protein
MKTTRIFFLEKLTTQTHFIMPGIVLKYAGSYLIARFTLVSVMVRVAVVVCMIFACELLQHFKKKNKESWNEINR